MKFLIPLLLVSSLSASPIRMHQHQDVPEQDVDQVYESLWNSVEEMVTQDVMKKIIFNRNKRISITITITLDPKEKEELDQSEINE